MADSGSGVPAPRKRSDARRNEETLLAAAAATFTASGVDAPVRDTAAAAGVGTIYRHFPTRADLIAAVYRHQVETCTQAGPPLLNDGRSPLSALTDWIDLFIDFLITKRGLASALRSDSAAFCIGADTDTDYGARRLVQLVIAGLRPQ